MAAKTAIQVINQPRSLISNRLEGVSKDGILSGDRQGSMRSITKESCITLASQPNSGKG
jgi:hypothetical protein